MFRPVYQVTAPGQSLLSLTASCLKRDFLNVNSNTLAVKNGLPATCATFVFYEIVMFILLHQHCVYVCVNVFVCLLISAALLIRLICRDCRLIWLWENFSRISECR